MVTLNVRIERKKFREDEPAALADIDLRLEQGKILGIYGGSGVGKSTLLRIIAGIDDGYEGAVSLDGFRVAGPSREIGFVTQQPVCFDWLSVIENIRFSRRFERTPATRVAWPPTLLGGSPVPSADQEALDVAAMVGLERRDLRKYPAQLSGGMLQRMALARALLPRPRVLLLDEPFSALDDASRRDLQDAVRDIRERTGTSFACVSHDPEEVVYLADEVVVLGGAPARVVRRIRVDLPEPRRGVALFELAETLRSFLRDTERRGDNHGH